MKTMRNTLRTAAVVLIAALIVIAGGTYAPAGNFVEKTGTLTAVFVNRGSDAVGVTAVYYLMPNQGGGGEETLGRALDIYMNVPAPLRSRTGLALNPGQSVTKTYEYRYRGGDYRFSAVGVETSYIDNWRHHQTTNTKQTYDWAADGTECTISYSGGMPPIPTITCTKK